jgi:hypothetical protein
MIRTIGIKLTRKWISNCHGLLLLTRMIEENRGKPWKAFVAK